MEYLISKEWTTETPFYFYKTTNLINGKFYYGSGSRMDYLGSGTNLIRAIKKYGKENFRIEKLRFFKTRKDAFYYEDRFLKLYKVNSLVESYNLINSGKTGTCGLKMSQESRDKMSAAKQNMSQETKDKMSELRKGKPKSQEHKDKIIKANTGKKRSQETKDKMSLSKQNVSQETKDKISAAHKGKPKSQEHKDKMSAANTGKKHSQETRDKLSAAKQNMSQETKDKMSLSKQNMSQETKYKMSESRKGKTRGKYKKRISNL
jgi:hypothetical protein